LKIRIQTFIHKNIQINPEKRTMVSTKIY